MTQFIAKHGAGESQATPSDYCCFGPFVCTADKRLICPQYAVSCFWLDHLQRRMSKIEETLECGVDTLPPITRGCHMLKSNEYRGKDCLRAPSSRRCFQDKIGFVIVEDLVIVDEVFQQREGKEEEMKVK